MTPAVSISGLRKSFSRPGPAGASAFEALAGIDLDITPGEFFGLLGPNGAGKTTLISCLAGLTRPSSGCIRLHGQDVARDYRQARRLLGVVPQELVFDPFLTVRSTLEFQSGYYGITDNGLWIDEVLEELGLSDKADTNMRRLSGGMKRRVLVAQALVHRPQVIVLDEPTAGVDVELRQGLWRFIERLNREGHTIILTTHYLEEAEALCSRIAMLKQGSIVALDTTSNLLKKFSGHRLELRLTTECRVFELLESWQPESGKDGSVLLHLPDVAALELVLARLRQQGIGIVDLKLSPPDLETAFLRVMEDRS